MHHDGIAFRIRQALLLALFNPQEAINRVFPLNGLCPLPRMAILARNFGPSSLARKPWQSCNQT